MSFSANEEDDVFLDLLMLALAGFIAMVILLLPFVNPVAKDSTPPPGNMMVELVWPVEQDVDIDLWVMAPGERPVGYSNKGGKVFNLLRDDLGHNNDITAANYEIAYSRGLPVGEYVVNIHWFSKPAISVPVVMTINLNINGGMQQLFQEKIGMAAVGQEITVVRFQIDEHQELVYSSINHLPIKLRSR